MYSTFFKLEILPVPGRMTAATRSLRRCGGIGVELRHRHPGRRRKDCRPNVIFLTIGGLAAVYICTRHQDFGNQCGRDRPIDKI
jgi:hypothetical protein